MIRVSSDDFEKLTKMITKIGMPGSILAFTEKGSTLEVGLVDREGKSITIELTDTRYPMMPRITRTETF